MVVWVALFEFFQKLLHGYRSVSADIKFYSELHGAATSNLMYQLVTRTESVPQVVAWFVCYERKETS
jgi:hypothetical protein